MNHPAISSHWKVLYKYVNLNHPISFSCWIQKTMPTYITKSLKCSVQVCRLKSPIGDHPIYFSCWISKTMSTYIIKSLKCSVQVCRLKSPNPIAFEFPNHADLLYLRISFPSLTKYVDLNHPATSSRWNAPYKYVDLNLCFRLCLMLWSNYEKYADLQFNTASHDWWV